MRWVKYRGIGKTIEKTKKNVCVYCGRVVVGVSLYCCCCCCSAAPGTNITNDTTPHHETTMCRTLRLLCLWLPARVSFDFIAKQRISFCVAPSTSTDASLPSSVVCWIFGFYYSDLIPIRFRAARYNSTEHFWKNNLFKDYYYYFSSVFLFVCWNIYKV